MTIPKELQDKFKLIDGHEPAHGSIVVDHTGRGAGGFHSCHSFIQYNSANVSLSPAGRRVGCDYCTNDECGDEPCYCEDGDRAPFPKEDLEKYIQFIGEWNPKLKKYLEENPPNLETGEIKINTGHGLLNYQLCVLWRALWMYPRAVYVYMYFWEKGFKPWEAYMLGQCYAPEWAEGRGYDFPGMILWCWQRLRQTALAFIKDLSAHECEHTNIIGEKLTAPYLGPHSTVTPALIEKAKELGCEHIDSPIENMKQLIDWYSQPLS